VTFLFTDLEGSTRLWEQLPDAMRGALARHDEILRDAVEKRGGVVVKTTGDGLHAAFLTAQDAVVAAVDAQRAIGEEPWALPEPLRVRMGLHTGEADQREGDYFGTSVNRAARVSAAAHGGQILVSHVTEELVRDQLPEDLHLEDLGEHHLRDLARPERVFQVGGPGLTREFPPLRTSARVPTNLPTPPTELIGRDVEVDAVADELHRHRLVTITGVGGMGKTRLAVEVAASLASEHPDGVWFVDLAPALDGGDVVRAVATAMGATGAASSADALLGHLAERRTLLVLDNCEHVIDAVAQLTEAILARAPEVRMLATSREPLDVAGESVKHLRPLALPDATEQGPSAAADFAAVRLFEERARSGRSDFVVDEDNVDDVVEICRRLDGVPLAIELAAARVGAMSTADIRSRLGERFRLLAGSRRGHERHRTLLAAVEWSHDLLDAEEQRVFRSLSVFAGSFGLADATAVVAGESGDEFEVLDTVTRLVERSLVNHDGETGRYRLLETLRQFGDDRLVEAGDAEALRGRFADHFCAVAQREGPRMFGADHDEANAVLSDAIDNLRATAEWLGVVGRHQDLADLVSALWLHLSQEAPAEGVAWVSPLRRTDAEIDPQALYDALRAAASVTIVSGALEEAMALDEEAGALLERHSDIQASGWSQHVPVTIAVFMSDHGALPLCTRMVETAGLAEDPYAALYGRCAAVYLGSVEGKAVEAAVEELVAEGKGLGSPMWLGTALSLGASALITEAAIDRNAIAYLELLDRHPGWERAGSVLAGSILAGQSLALTRTDPRSSVAVAIDCIHLADRIGMDVNVVTAVRIAALGAALLGETEVAIRLFRHALAVATFETPNDAWIGPELIEAVTAAGAEREELTPEPLSRADLFATLAELERRQPAPGVTGEDEV